MFFSFSKASRLFNVMKFWTFLMYVNLCDIFNVIFYFYLMHSVECSLINIALTRIWSMSVDLIEKRKIAKNVKWCWICNSVLTTISTSTKSFNTRKDIDALIMQYFLNSFSISQCAYFKSIKSTRRRFDHFVSYI